MKRFLLLCAVTLSLNLFGCSQENSPPTTTPTTVAQATPNPTATPALPTVTKTTTLFPTLTETATGTPTITRTPRPPTPQPTATPTPGPSPTLLPPPSGSIIFLWDPMNSPPSNNGPRNNLFMASPGETAAEWRVDTLLEGLYGWPAAVSSDGTKLALTIFEDSDGSGSIETVGPSTDSANLFVYDLITDDLIRLTENYLDPWTVNWAPDSSTIAYARFERLFSVNVNSLTINTLIDQLPDKVARTSWSPDGTFLAIELQMGTLLLYNVITGEITYLDNVPAGNSETVQWSPNSEWLLSSIWSVSKGLFVVNVLSQETLTVVDADYFSLFAWSPDNQYLAYGQGTRNDITRVFDSSILLWNTDTRTSQLLIPEIQTKSQVIWTPDGTQLVIGHLTNEDQTLALSLIDINTGQMTTLWQSSSIDPNSFVNPIGWSPDGQWLLFYTEDIRFGPNVETLMGGYISFIVAAENQY